MARDVNKLRQFVLILLVTVGCSAFAGLRFRQLRCEYVKNPLGIDVRQPQLSWILESIERGQRQTTYQILVASGTDELKKDRRDLWSSGKVFSDQTTFILYGGRLLTSRARLTASAWQASRRAV